MVQVLESWLGERMGKWLMRIDFGDVGGDGFLRTTTRRMKVPSWSILNLNLDIL